MLSLAKPGSRDCSSILRTKPARPNLSAISSFSDLRSGQAGRINA